MTLETAAACFKHLGSLANYSPPSWRGTIRHRAMKLADFAKQLQVLRATKEDRQNCRAALNPKGDNYVEPFHRTQPRTAARRSEARSLRLICVPVACGPDQDRSHSQRKSV